MTWLVIRSEIFAFIVGSLAVHLKPYVVTRQGISRQSPPGLAHKQKMNGDGVSCLWDVVSFVVDEATSPVVVIGWTRNLVHYPSSGLVFD